jgi:hypothetical protein
MFGSFILLPFANKNEVFITKQGTNPRKNKIVYQNKPRVKQNVF